VIVTIDGPAGSGKSTVARKVANKLAFIHLNSGALFRAVGLKASSLGLSLDDDDVIAKLGAETSFQFVLSEDRGSSEEGRKTRLFVDGEDWEGRLFSAECSRLASKVAVLPKLRALLVDVQRKAAAGASVVLEGRDAGTVVFPDADVKFYLDASVPVRAARRLEDIRTGDTAATLESVQREIEARDHRDETRLHGPQVAAPDAIRIDTSALSVDEVVEALCGKIEECRIASQ
jgi:cytidylate kinase